MTRARRATKAQRQTLEMIAKLEAPKPRLVLACYDRGWVEWHKGLWKLTDAGRREVEGRDE